MQEGKQSALDEEKIAELDSLQFTWEEPQADSGDDIVDSEAVAGALAAAAGMNHAEPMELDVQGPVFGGDQVAEEATAEDLLNVAI